PLALLKLWKKNLQSGEEELAFRLDHSEAKATWHFLLIRYSQYHMDASLTPGFLTPPIPWEKSHL
ncbi:hypothetical protein DBR06_SOUSAS24410035, partial [Sousa chinensis]